VYYGPGEGGKTTNLRYIYDNLEPSIRSELTSLENADERTMFFDFMSVDLGEVKGFNTRFGLYSSPGQENLNAARNMVLNGADGIIFVVDSRVEKLQDNIDSLNNLENNLKQCGMSIDKIPLVFQYNKRDLENIVPLDELERKINKNGNPGFEAVATEGMGVFACLKAISNEILTSLQ